ncbi:MAG: metalloregulator ArsR/SmtB family transcription factor [Bacteroidota bacterium]
MPKKITTDEDLLDDISETLRVMAHPIRLAIIELLFEEKERSVTDIHQTIGIEQAVASHHLRILKSKKVVQVRRDGQRSLYALKHEGYHNIVQLMADLK